ncbi:MAG: hypothetical protein NTW79_00570, partial [Candidatus Berkelbacteria bacterium]|nr:hypothetical protein [Candidatus Berkelbacteria bacterium]
KSQRKRQKPKRKTRNQQKNHLKSEVFNLEDHFFQKLINLEVWRQRQGRQPDVGNQIDVFASDWKI